MDEKIPSYALDLRNISRLVKTKQKYTRKMRNGQYWDFLPRESIKFSDVMFQWQRRNHSRVNL